MQTSCCPLSGSVLPPLLLLMLGEPSFNIMVRGAACLQGDVTLLFLSLQEEGEAAGTV